MKLENETKVTAKNAAEVEEVNAENAKAAEKVAFFENLKEKHDGKIFIDDVLNAWNLATCTLGKLKKNNTKTTNAGYTVLENSVGDWVSVLNDRFEVNLTTGQTFNVWTDSAAIENAKNYAWDEVEENIFHAKNADEKTFWLNVCKAKFVNSLITLGVKDLVAAEIIREEEIIACVDDYFVNSDDAAEVEIKNAENANAAEENAEVKKFEVGKWYYDCCISANKSPAYKVTHRTKKMVTLTDDFGEIIKRKIDATSSVEKVSFNGDIMPIFLQADCFCTNAEEIQKAEDALAYSLAADNGNITVEETDPNAKLIACIDDYSVNVDVAAEVEEVNEKPSEKEIFQAKIAEIKNRKHKSCIDWDAVYNDFRIAEIFNLQKDFKKFLKLGEMKRAENVFENLKLCFKAA